MLAQGEFPHGAVTLGPLDPIIVLTIVSVDFLNPECTCSIMQSYARSVRACWPLLSYDTQMTSTTVRPISLWGSRRHRQEPKYLPFESCSHQDFRPFYILFQSLQSHSSRV